MGRSIKADAVSELNQSLSGVTAGNNIALAARNQYCGAILSSLGGLLGAGMNFVGSHPTPTGFGDQRSATGTGYMGVPGHSQSSPSMWQGIGFVGGFA